MQASSGIQIQFLQAIKQVYMLLLCNFLEIGLYAWEASYPQQKIARRQPPEQLFVLIDNLAIHHGHDHINL